MFVLTVQNLTYICFLTSSCFPQFDGFICRPGQHEALFRQDDHSPHCCRVTLESEHTGCRSVFASLESSMGANQLPPTSSVIIHLSWSHTLAVVSHEPLKSVPNFPEDRLQTVDIF